MRIPPAQTSSGGADERLPSRQPGNEPGPAGEALVEHLVDRLATVEEALRSAGDRADSAEAGRALVSRVARQLAGHHGSSLDALVRLALPALGHWCIMEVEVGDHLLRSVAALEAAREGAASALAGTLAAEGEESVAFARVRRGGRVERLEVMPDLAGAPGAVTRALDALGDGPVLLVPVATGGRLSAALAFGRTAASDARYDGADQRLATDLAALLGVALERQRAIADADQAARAKSEFLTMMSHELRTPLNAIAGYAQLLEMGFRGPLNDDQREAVGRIIRGQEHLLELVDSVLTFSRLTSGRLVIDRAELSASALLDVATDPLRREFAARGIELEIVNHAGDARVLADHERAPQVLRHLLGNALKFTAPGGRVRVSCSCTGSRVHFTVADTGRGIPAAQREAIFHPFVQVEKGHTRSADGSGLGLAIGRELAERMGGSLVVSSEVGVGSRFVFALPRATATDRRGAAQE
ncbi:MAG: ATP-binding region ATPase domain protein [Gemmatimonadetes bacterium]|nr:ATP-binding region ATPase domain protein [Gemmatimonadota bacterium]